MTLTEAPPQPAPSAEPASLPVAGGSLFATADHKRIGRLYIGFALLFLVAGGLVGGLLQAELVSSGVQVTGNAFARLFSFHATVTTLLFLAPLWVGLATYVVPLQIGATGLAFPRLQALALWTYVVGGGLVVAAYVVGTPRGAGLSLSTPIRVTGASATATDLWVMGLALVGVAALLAAVNLLATVVTLRTEGMSFDRLPFFTWAVFSSAAVMVVATPTFLAGVLLLYLDQHFGGTFFSTGTRGAQQIWQHLLWLFGRPEVYLLTLPGLGVASEIVAVHSPKPFANRRVVLGALGAVAILSLGAWAAGASAATAVVLPTYSVLTALVAAPAGVLVLMWLDALRRSRPHPHVTLAYVGGYLVLVLFGVANTVVAAIARVDAGTAWSTGHIHVLVLGAPVLLAFAGVHHWAPKIWGRQLSQALGALEVLLLVGGFLVMGLADYLLGYDGAPWHVADIGGKGSWLALERLGAGGAALVTLGVLVFVANLLRSVAGGRGAPAADDPWQGSTLEWATTSPPPDHNFDAVPDVRSAEPVTHD
jgi:cytochrome c oxidase subunit 1